MSRGHNGLPSGDGHYPVAPPRLPVMNDERPSQIQQAKEAARDDPRPNELANLLCSLRTVSAHVAGDPVDHHAPMLVVDVASQGIDRTDDVLAICRRAGWRLEGLTWERRTLRFSPRPGTPMGQYDRPTTVRRR